MPQSKDGKLIKNKGSIKLWLSNDDYKIPIKIENRTNIGDMIMKLKKIKWWIFVLLLILIVVQKNL